MTDLELPVPQEKPDSVSGGKLELLDLQTPAMGLEVPMSRLEIDLAACTTLEMTLTEKPDIMKDLISQIRASNLGATSQLTGKPAVTTPPEEEGSQQVAAELIPGREIPILATTPPESEEASSPRGSPLNTEAKEYIHKDTTETAYIEEPRSTLQRMMWLYSSELAKECKGQCPMVREGKCKCQSNADKVLSDLDIISDDTQYLDEKIWDRLLGNMKAMLNFFWSQHEDERSPRNFDLGYPGFKLLQAFRQEEFRIERDLFEEIFEVQFRAPLENILADRRMTSYVRIEQMHAREHGFIVLKDVTYSNLELQ